jgi:hypothetical protein
VSQALIGKGKIRECNIMEATISTMPVDIQKANVFENAHLAMEVQKANNSS